MAQQAPPIDKLLQRPLYIFALPEELLASLQLQTPPDAAPETLETPPPTPASPSLNGAEGQEQGHKAATSCTLCGLAFADLQEQRSHARSDQHGYNIKQKLRGRPPVGEADFERLLGQLDESLSGSDSSESESGDEDGQEGVKAKDTTLSALLKRQAKVHDGDADDAPVRQRRRGAGTAPMLWFSSSKLPSNTSLGVYRALFSTQEQAADHVLDTIKRKQLAPKPAPHPQKQKPPPASSPEDGAPKLLPSTLPPPSSAAEPHYFLCMIGGGHFAALLVSLAPAPTKKSSAPDTPPPTILAHKTFHRYTTRRKQGGSQSANDASKGAAHSAGAGIRRYNESALTAEVRALLSEWRTWIVSAELCFVRATGSTNRRTLFGPYDEQVLDPRDARLRGFPFNTRRATQGELLRAFAELTRVKVDVVDDALLAKRAEEAASAARAKAEAARLASEHKAANTAKLAKPSKADEEAAQHTTQLQALIRRSKAPALLAYLASNGLSPEVRFFPPEAHFHASTPLLLAAAERSAVCVLALLVRGGADPAVRSGEGRTAWEIAGDRATRDSLRRARDALGEERWDWDGGAHVPSPLSQADVEARAAVEQKDLDAEAAAEGLRRAAEVERLRKADEGAGEGVKERKFGKGRVLAQASVTAEERRALEGRGMTEAMRALLERERRARAAEERVRRLRGG
ncbi:hypothetical protein LTR08_006610 [Meristemomyces frigidus]|nr:hypothetical protein LTR08_006610 [Meristemomyces frigidus]